MPQTIVQRLIQYYQQCFQASFHSSEGHGIFDRDDVTVLDVRALNDDSQFELSEAHLSAWLVDADANDLVLFSGIALSNSPNKSFTTQVHYQPVKAIPDFQLISNRLKQFAETNDSEALAHFQAMLQGLDLAALKEQVSTFDDVVSQTATELPLIEFDDIPDNATLAKWLVKLAKQLNHPHQVTIQVLALVPKDLRSFQVKADFIHHLSTIAHSAGKANHYPLLNYLFDSDKSSSIENPNQPLQSKLARLGFGKNLYLPALSSRQNKALQNAFRCPVSLIQGPPGTGKSYAIANLAAVLASLNKSVLITAGSDAALDVLQAKLTDHLNVDRSLIVRFGKGQRHGRFAQQLIKLLKFTEQHDAQQELLKEYEALVELQELVEKSQQEVQTTIEQFPVPSEAILLGDGSLKERFIRRFFWHRQHRSSQGLRDQIANLLQRILQHQDNLGAVANAVSKQRFQRAAGRSRTNISQYAQRIAKSSVKVAHDELVKAGEPPVPLQTALSIWLVKLDDLPECSVGEFDCVIVDEATQVNITSALPAVACARSLVVSGDPKQLRHYSFLSKAQEKRIAEELDLDSDSVSPFRSTSFFDLVHNQLMHAGKTNAITLLDEHYRSIPPLMRFNSKQFYDNDIKVFTGLEQDPGHALKLSWQFVDGKRIDKLNTTEVFAIIGEIKKIISTEATLSGKTSLGVLSFFTDQTEALKKAILSELSLQDIKAHQIKVGTPFSFQGAERDHMLISCAVDEDSVAGTWNYLNRPDVFNVATSRAREQQTLFLSVPVNKMPTNSVLRQYHDFSLPQTSIVKRKNESGWFEAMINVFNQCGYGVEVHHRIADVDIDLLLTKEHLRLAVDLIGFPGDLGAAVHLNRYAALERVGIPLFALTAFDWMFAQEETLKSIQTKLADVINRLHATQEHMLAVQKVSNPVIKTEPILAAQPMELVNERPWRQFISASQTPELSAAWGFNLNEVKDKLEHLDQLLPRLFEQGSITYMRYQSAVNTAVDQLLENLKTYQLLYGQVWESAGTDGDYWNDLTKPIFDRHYKITDVLTKLHREMQMEVAKSGQLDEFVLKDLEQLSERLQKY